ncbi:MAG: hypothetical protein AB7I41_21440 [Candidatus Sericytochromatia bacterium]
MTEIWLDLDTAALGSLRKLLLALGAVERNETVMAPTRSPAQIFYLQNGRVIALNNQHQLLPGRKIIGAGFRMLTNPSNASAPKSQIVKPTLAHGIWLSLMP